MSAYNDELVKRALMWFGDPEEVNNMVKYGVVRTETIVDYYLSHHPWDAPRIPPEEAQTQAGNSPNG